MNVSHVCVQNQLSSHWQTLLTDLNLFSSTQLREMSTASLQWSTTSRRNIFSVIHDLEKTKKIATVLCQIQMHLVHLLFKDKINSWRLIFFLLSRQNNLSGSCMFFDLKSIKHTHIVDLSSIISVLESMTISVLFQ